MGKSKELEFTKIVNETKKIVFKAITTHLYPKFYEYIDDVVQETYLRAYKSLIKNKFRGDSSISSWLYIIAKNESLRMNKKLLKHETPLDTVVEEISFYISSNNNLQCDLISIVNELPEKFKHIFNLKLEGYTENEISEKLDISKGTIKSRAHRGKKLLLKQLNEMIKC
jgi:RNA polymerase sigma-70 factor, ECF subfamily